MSHHSFSPPAEGEYAEYYQRYIGLVPDGDVFDILEEQLRLTLDLLLGMSEEQAGFAYAEGKWSIKQVIGHVIDTERVFAYRGLRIARGDSTPLPGFEQDDYVSGADFNARSRMSLSGELEHLRRSNLFLFSTWDAEVQQRRGTASGFSLSARAVPYILAGHERHHLNVITERYLPHIPG